MREHSVDLIRIGGQEVRHGGVGLFHVPVSRLLFQNGDAGEVGQGVLEARFQVDAARCAGRRLDNYNVAFAAERFRDGIGDYGAGFIVGHGNQTMANGVRIHVDADDRNARHFRFFDRGTQRGLVVGLDDDAVILLRDAVVYERHLLVSVLFAVVGINRNVSPVSSFVLDAVAPCGAVGFGRGGRDPRDTQFIGVRILVRGEGASHRQYDQCRHQNGQDLLHFNSPSFSLFLFFRRFVTPFDGALCALLKLE